MDHQESRLPVWDLRPFYQGPSDPAIDRDLAGALSAAAAFRDTYRDRLARLCRTPRETSVALEAFEELQQKMASPVHYARLLHAADSGSAEARVLHARVMEAWRLFRKTLLFFSLQLAGMGAENLRERGDDPACRHYKRYLERLGLEAPYFLPEVAERVILDKDRTGCEAWRIFYDITTGGLMIPLAGGNQGAVPLAEALSKLHRRDRQTRERVFGEICNALRACSGRLAFTLDTLVHDEMLGWAERGFSSPLQGPALGLGVGVAQVLELLERVETYYPLAARYFRLKAGALRSQRLDMADLHAPWPGGEGWVGFGDSRRILEEAAAQVDSRWGSVVQSVFSEHRIHAAPGAGKQLGAFCHAPAPAGVPYVFLSYAGALKDFTTLAHELGHAIHYGLSANQTFLNFEAPFALQEAAATLFELLACRQLEQMSSFNGMRLQIQAVRIESIIVTVLRQTALTRFELALMEERRRSSALDAEKIGAVWLKEIRRLYGGGLDVPDICREGWALVPHVFLRPFSCWGYVYGQLLSLCFYRRYLEEGSGFMARLTRFLEAGGSAEPEVALADLGVDLNDSAFVREAFGTFEAFLADLERMWERESPP